MVFPAEIKSGDTLSCFHTHTINKCSFHGLFSAIFHIFVGNFAS